MSRRNKGRGLNSNWFQVMKLFHFLINDHFDVACKFAFRKLYVAPLRVERSSNVDLVFAMGASDGFAHRNT